MDCNVYLDEMCLSCSFGALLLLRGGPRPCPYNGMSTVFHDEGGAKRLLLLLAAETGESKGPPWPAGGRAPLLTLPFEETGSGSSVSDVLAPAALEGADSADELGSVRWGPARVGLGVGPISVGDSSSEAAIVPRPELVRLGVLKPLARLLSCGVISLFGVASPRTITSCSTTSL
ncbi:MAG: hypothetical protein FRX49_02139 [Trebouxia sp. A1-2]|nr:MAG: hypothetical protein FRX49_02139 [Trebouxia sp. A1-2]